RRGGRDRGLRARQRERIRPGRGTGRGTLHRRLDRRPHGTCGRYGIAAVVPRGNRGRVASGEAGMSRRRVVLVDDHDLFRAGVRSELGEAGEIVGGAGSVTEAVPLIRELDPDVVLLDVHLPDGGGHAVIAQVAPERPGVRLLALSASDAAEGGVGVIRAGARGYV